MALIRIATKAWDVTRAAKERKDGLIGLDVVWVEIDGHRFDHVTDAQVTLAQGAFTEVTLTFAAAAEMVLLGPEGEILQARA